MKSNANLAQARIDRAIKEEGDYYATHPSMVERFLGFRINMNLEKF